MELPERTKFQVMAPIARGKKGTFKKELLEYSKQGFVRARIDGEIHDLSEKINLKN